jgi:hypothetical protein
MRARMLTLLLCSLVFLSGCTDAPMSDEQIQDLPDRDLRYYSLSPKNKDEEERLRAEIHKREQQTFQLELTPPEAKLNKWDGFRGLKWGVNIRDVNDPNMVLLEENKELTTYRRAADQLSIGNAKLSKITYMCYEDRFCAVLLKTEQLSNFNYLKDAVFAYYGEGYKPNRFIDAWYWGSKFPKGARDVLMILEYNEFSEETKMVIAYQPIWGEKENDDARAAKEASRDF